MQNLNVIKSKIKGIINTKQLKIEPQIVAVTKTFTLSKFKPLLENGHIHFGENKIQEVENKWSEIVNRFTHFKLHMIGRLQSNKAKKAVELFDYIHSLDSSSLALKINKYEKELNKKTKLFIQVNVAYESQKSGIPLDELDNFFYYCTKELSLNIIGLMILPPINQDPNRYFKILRDKSRELKLFDLSMGMSSDYIEAIENESTFLRLGTAIFGERKI